MNGQTMNGWIGVVLGVFVGCGGARGEGPRSEGSGLAAATPAERMKEAFLTAPGFRAFAAKQAAQPGAACQTPNVDVLELGSDVSGSRSRSWRMYVATPACGKDDAYAAVVEHQTDLDGPNGAHDKLRVFDAALNGAIQTALVAPRGGSGGALEADRGNLPAAFRASAGYADFVKAAPPNSITQVESLPLTARHGKQGREEVVLFLATDDQPGRHDSYAALVKRSSDGSESASTVEVLAEPLNDAIRLAVDTVL